MNLLLASPDKAFGTSNYQLLDSGDGYILEQIGHLRIVRPVPTAVWAPATPKSSWKADAWWIKNEKSAGSWVWKSNQKEKEHALTYTSPYDLSMTLKLRFAQSKNIGAFPEHQAHWAWMMDRIARATTRHKQINVLNLFGYTGGATLCAAAAGAQVCHVDASSAAINLAKLNAHASGLKEAPIRWINDDCSTFVQREIKRGVRYDALIIDPPAFGRDTNGTIFEFEKRIRQLLHQCSKLLPEKPLFIVFTGYAMGYSPQVLGNLLADKYPQATLEVGELALQESARGRMLPCSIFARM